MCEVLLYLVCCIWFCCIYLIAMINTGWYLASASEFILAHGPYSLLMNVDKTHERTFVVNLFFLSLVQIREDHHTFQMDKCGHLSHVVTFINNVSQEKMDATMAWYAAQCATQFFQDILTDYVALGNVPTREGYFAYSHLRHLNALNIALPQYAPFGNANNLINELAEMHM